MEPSTDQKPNTRFQKFQHPTASTSKSAQSASGSKRAKPHEKRDDVSCPYPMEPEPTKAHEDALRSQRNALTKQIEENEKVHHDLVAQRHAIDKELRDDFINTAADAVLGPVPDLPPVTNATTPEEASQPVTIFGVTMPKKTLVYGLLCLIAGGIMFPLFGNMVATTLLDVASGAYNHDQSIAAVVFFAIYCVLMLLMGVGLLYLGTRMLRQRKDGRVPLTNGLLIVLIALFLFRLTVFGVGNVLIIYGIIAALLVLVHGYFEPEIALERYNEISDDKTLRQMLKRDDVERTYIPGKRPGKGYISLNFFNLFWIFTICSFLGLIIETIFHMVIVDPGVYQDRAGMLWGPLSPIYGFGGGLMTIFLNRLHDKPIWITFIISAIVGGAFEYFTSWYLQYAFGITAWNYSGTFLNIDGRTNFMFMCFWGILGVVWVRVLLPVMLYFMKKIPWRWKYTLTTLFAIFVIFDGVMTTVTLDCWYLREDHVPVEGVVETFCAEHFDNQFMENRFQSMTMNVKDSARTGSR